MAAKLTKKRKTLAEKVQRDKTYPLSEAIKLIKECAKAKFNESIDVAINLGIDSRKSDQAIRGATVLPHGSGRTVKVAVFAQGDNVEKAKAAGADIVGLDDLAERIQGGDIDFDVVIATPETMRVVGKLGQVLGPRGLMPNPKVGTVTTDVASAVKNAKQGQVRYRTDKNGIIHCTIGKVNFEEKALEENFLALLNDIKKAKPSAAKGTYLKKLTLSSTMGPGIAIDRTTVGA
ncbi:50S ribosomal protein L1 [Coxiella burnetii]|uniref:Large ribosomal subunit protein uL1 n=3 Tax=Coxiella burnetii TaxID=777 RepID=RL1_COXBU|nr:50S ribosomal protein L1 [Coxiella burnetii]NP_819271.1 50S ribosomal protein L1 [Coxiella burnetii RSA 493]A9NAL1.1 RecName: Full=Large ribosomal subunit protein uL1; AltName: Full=50S ribosomal protein L1 [Coxiella burnetii RSA 331]Q83ET3.1 RecName: Full=Large ribosomal subunit protein uL1; AltName: Full=50S ribosomal protein L1 [Coxiella burnetii RSA 493]AAO89785.1 LSU ribosomal protein L1P [Coxiella burnetii RSA 493]ABX77484.1 ribosomal protein L1 [Coxiella burnetii RSA 331]ALE59696.1 